MAHDSHWRRLTEAAICYADASDDDADFLRARDRLRKAAVAYVTSLGHEIPRRHPRRVVVLTTAQLGFWPRLTS